MPRISITVSQNQYDEMTGVAHDNGFAGLNDWFENIFVTLYGDNRVKRLLLATNRQTNKFLAVMAAMGQKVEQVDAPENVVPFKKPGVVKPTGNDPEFTVGPREEKKIDDILKNQDTENPDEVS